MKTNKLQSLELLTEAIEQSGIDIAPTYAEYMPIAFAIANDCQEAGRDYFHRICRICPKYNKEDADKIYDGALQKNDHRNGLGTVFHHAKRAGVSLDAVYQRIADEINVHTCIARDHFFENEAGQQSGLGDGLDPCDQLMDDSDPKSPLPTLDKSSLPALLKEIVSYGETEMQRDALLLSSIAVMGATLGWHVRSMISKKFVSPCLQVFVLAKPASGKNIMALAKYLAYGLHERIRAEVEREMAKYDADLEVYASVKKKDKQGEGKQETAIERPKRPANRMFLIPGNNTGTGIAQNIIESDGSGLIFETEADTLITAIGGDYGHFSDTIRNSFDHAGISFNRRTNDEYRSCKRMFLGLVLSGTCNQFKKLVKDAEDGTLSRMVTYYMQPTLHWMDPLSYDENTLDNETVFESIGQEWLMIRDAIVGAGVFTLKLTTDQKKKHKEKFDKLFTQAQIIFGDDVRASAARLANNNLRMMMVVAVLRYMEDTGGGLATPTGKTADNWPVRGAQSFDHELRITDSDFDMVLSWVDPLLEHIGHSLSMLPSTKVKRRGLAEKQTVFNMMGRRFTRQEFIKAAADLGVNENTASSWLVRMGKKGLIRKDEQTDEFVKV